MVEDTAAMVENAEEDDVGDAGGLSEGDGGEGGLEVVRGINGLHRSENPSGWKRKTVSFHLIGLLSPPPFFSLFLNSPPPSLSKTGATCHGCSSFFTCKISHAKALHMISI
ncbi:hypothetical protein L2E82_11737 [Cichorium intybus]|uniref:Uncharacterized protein n=1 Tax=Cichorium intybus TaxID=13427 RepID=A0ACB9GE54_CICIN|nr:hypothetical protein L2E82_11737 [Cichorium intybus]